MYVLIQVPEREKPLRLSKIHATEFMLNYFFNGKEALEKNERESRDI